MDAGQVERYLDLARAQNIDAVITISNQHANIPSHYPIKVSGKKTRTVNLHHWSWKSLLTEAALHTDDNKDVKSVNDETQLYILNEFKRFLKHKNTGVTVHAQMDKSWSVVCSEGGLENKTEDTTAAVLSWHSLCRDLALTLSEETGVDVAQAIPNKYIKPKNGYTEKLKDDVESLYVNGCLSTSIKITNAASNLSILANVREKYFSVSMTLRVSKDAKTAQGAIGWILKQLKGVELDGLHVTACYAGKNSNKTCALNVLIEDGYQALAHDNRKNIPHSFDVYLKNDLKLSEIKGIRKFPEIVKKSTDSYYFHVGENLKKAQNKAPKISRNKENDAGDIVDINIEKPVSE